MLRKSEFRSIVSGYRPLECEIERGGHYLQQCAYRYYRMLAFLDGKSAETVLDIGCYPGTLLRLLRGRYPQMQLHGLGLGLDAIRAAMEDAQIQLHDVNLDPDVYFEEYHTIPVEWGITDSSVDVVFATEVIEHLYNPFNMLRRAARALRPGGYFYLTTDNIANLWAVICIMRGHSPSGPLSLSSVVNESKNNWRGHVRLYSRRELQDVVDAVGLRVLSVKQFWNKKWYSVSTHSPMERLLRNYVAWLVPPPFRGHHELIARKPL